MDKKSFLENEKQVEQDMTAKEILAERVKELGLGYEQVEVEPKVMLPTYNYLGEVDKFEAYENTVGAMQFISNPSFSAESQELSSYYLGGTFVTNTCEKMLTINPLEEPEAPESVVTEVEGLDLVGDIEEEGIACIIPLENISGWDEDLSTWDKPVDEKGNEIEGEWVVLNGGAVYTGGETATLTISFIPVAKDTYEPVNINKVIEVKAGGSTLLQGLQGFFPCDNNIEVVQNLEWTKGSDYEEADGITGKGIVIKSTTSGLTCSDTTKYEAFTINDATFAGWCKFTSNGSIPIILNWMSDRVYNSLAINKISDEKVRIAYYFADGNRDSSYPWDSEYEVECNCMEWNHYVITKKIIGSWQIFTSYLNGNIVLTKQYSSSASTYSYSKSIAQHKGWATYTTGVIDEVGIWNRVLTAEEVNNLYQAGLHGVTYPFKRY